LCNKAFTPQRVALMEPHIRELTHALVDRFVHAGEADLTTALALPLPTLVIGGIVGVPRDDIEKFAGWSAEWMTMLFVVGLPLERQLAGARSTVALQRYSAEMIAQRREQPRDDFLSDLVHARLEDGSSLDTVELVGVINSFLTAGHVTTKDLI